jgi:DUF971 family protein
MMARVDESHGTPPLEAGLDERHLRLTWADGHVTRIELEELRVRCPCARCREMRETGAAIWPRPGVPEELRAEEAELVGGWGLSIRWNDRHETGIYPWGTLRSWCRCPECADQA